MIEKLIEIGGGEIVPFSSKPKNLEAISFLVAGKKGSLKIPAKVKLVHPDYVMDFISHEKEPDLAKYLLL